MEKYVVVDALRTRYVDEGKGPVAELKGRKASEFIDAAPLKEVEREGFFVLPKL